VIEDKLTQQIIKNNRVQKKKPRTKTYEQPTKSGLVKTVAKDMIFFFPTFEPL
jgi:hypothetical protein